MANPIEDFAQYLIELVRCGHPTDVRTLREPTRQLSFLHS
jgi:hypothetical protein